MWHTRPYSRPENKGRVPPLPPLDKLSSDETVSGKAIFNKDHLGTTTHLDVLGQGKKLPHIIARNIVECH